MLKNYHLERSAGGWKQYIITKLNLKHVFEGPAKDDAHASSTDN